MSNSARYLSALLALSYPVTAHLAVSRHSASLAVLAIALLAAAVLVPPLMRGKRTAWIALPCVALGIWLMARTQSHALSLYAPPVLIPAFMAWGFGHTLLQHQTPLIAQFVRLLHAPDDAIDAAVWPYARRLTWVWTLLLSGIALTNLLLAALIAPDGWLLAAGIKPPVTVSQQQWSLFANLLGYLLIAAFFVSEYVYRRHRFPHQPHRNFFEFLRRTLAASPRLLTSQRSD